MELKTISREEILYLLLLYQGHVLLFVNRYSHYCRYTRRDVSSTVIIGVDFTNILSVSLVLSHIFVLSLC